MNRAGPFSPLTPPARPKPSRDIVRFARTGAAGHCIALEGRGEGPALSPLRGEGDMNSLPLRPLGGGPGAGVRWALSTPGSWVGWTSDFGRVLETLNQDRVMFHHWALGIRWSRPGMENAQWTMDNAQSARSVHG